MKRRRISFHTLLPGFCLVFTLFVFAPVDLYLSFEDELWFSMGSLVKWLAVFGITAFAAVSLLSVFLPQKLSVAFRAALYAGAFLTWLQGNLLTISYGTLDGREIDWSSYTVPYLLDALLWIGVTALFIFLMFRLRKKFRRILEAAACILLITEAVSLSVFLIRSKPWSEPVEDQYLSRDGLYTVSQEDNTVVFVLDTVDSIFFENMTVKYPEKIGEAFADFTFYRDTAGGAARTKYAIPQILCGEVNRKEQPYGAYLTEAYSASPLMNELAGGKYDTGIYTFSKYVDLNRSDAIGNMGYGTRVVTSSFRLTKKFMRLVCFRYAPSVLARFFWMYPGDFDSFSGTRNSAEEYVLDDARVKRELAEKGLQAAARKPAFRFIHLKGVHTPYILDENCEDVGYGNTSEERQCLGALGIVSDYLKQLKTLGLYDRATVLILADHGSYDHSSVGQSPLFMAKLRGESHPFAASDLPLSYFSLQEIMISALHGELASLEPCKTTQPRYFYKRSEENSVISLTEYVIDGPVQEAPAVETGVVYHENSLNNTREYKLGTKLHFDERDTARAHFVYGIANNEGSNVWTVGNDAEMLFIIDGEPQDMELELIHGTYSNSEQTVEIWANGSHVGTYTASGVGIHKISIPAGIMENGELRLRLHLPDAFSPASLGRSGDDRLLALSMRSMVIRGTGGKEK